MDWMQFGGNAQRENRCDSKIQLPLRLAWTSRANDHIADSSLIVGTWAFFGSIDCTYRCVNLHSGEPIWTHCMDPRSEMRGRLDVPNWPVPTGACVVGDVLVLGSQLGYLQGLDIATGQRLWVKRVNRFIQNRILLAGPRVVCSHQNRGESDYRLATLEADGKVVWEAQLPGSCSALAASADQGFGLIYRGEFAAVFSFDLNTGKVGWQRDFTKELCSAILVHDETLVVGSPAKGVYGLSIQNGEELWCIPEQGLSAPPVVADGCLYVADGDLFAYDMKSFRLLWKSAWREGLPFNDYKWSAPIVSGEYILIGGGQHSSIFCHSRATGEQVWWYQTGDWVFSSPVIVGNRLLIGSHDGNMYCFEGASGS